MAELIVESGPQKGTRVAIHPERPCTVGSDPDCALVLPPPAPSQAFVVKPLKDQGFGVKALTAGVTLNGTELAAARLNEGDVVVVGPTQLRYTTQAAPAQKVLGGFRLIEVLGKGGMGVVYKAEQVSLRRMVALKVLSHDLTQDPVFVARFVAEARAAARLSHPNVVQVFDVGHDGDTYYYSMELMAGGSLETLLKQVGTVPVERAVAAILDAAKGLAYAESLRIVHRDIKPDNLMYDAHDVVKIVDLGLAQSDEESTAKIIGTPHFMAPEQALRQPVDHRTDLYALGCTFYRLVTGTTPFKGASAKEILRAQVKDEAEPANKVNPAVPAEIAAILANLMQKDPAARYQSATELTDALQSAMAAGPRRGLWIAAALVVVGLVVAVVVLSQRGDDKPTEPQVIREIDPNAEKNLQERRELAAERAHFDVHRSDTAGIARAEAFEKVAKEHPGTAGAAKAEKRAREIRAEVAAAEAQAAARKSRIGAEVARVTATFDAALGKAAFGEAFTASSGADVAAELRDDAAVTEALAALRKRLTDAANKRLGELTDALAKARAAEDRTAIADAAKAIDAVLADDGWPAELVPNADALKTAVADARKTVDDLRAAARAAREAEAQTTLLRAFVEPDGVLAQIHRFATAGAATRVTELTKAIEGTDAAKRATALGAAVTAAAAYEMALVATFAAGTLAVGVDDESEPVVAVAFATDGAGAGLGVRPAARPGAKPTVLPLAEVRARIVAGTLRVPDRDAPDAVAYRALHALALVWRASTDFLSNPNVAAENGAAVPYDLDPTLLATAHAALEGLDTPWAAPLRVELTAARDLDSALRAFGTKRYTTASARLERLLRDHGARLVVAGLRK